MSAPIDDAAWERRRALEETAFSERVWVAPERRQRRPTFLDSAIVATAVVAFAAVPGRAALHLALPFLSSLFR